jgi:hypothetical protein
VRLYRYPPRALAGDYLRAAVGVGVGVGVLLSVPPTPVIVTVFGGMTGLFGYFGLRTLQRHVTKVAVTSEEICRRAFGTDIMTWRQLERFKLRYYGSKRQQRSSSGFLELTLTGGGTSLTFESNLDGFTYVAWRAAKAMRENGASIDPTSAGNLLAIGLDADGEKPPPEE